MPLYCIYGHAPDNDHALVSTTRTDDPKIADIAHDEYKRRGLIVNRTDEQ